MPKSLCVLHANCQGDALKILLQGSPDFDAKFTVTHLRNYLKEDMEKGQLDSCALFLHQYLVEQWGPLSTEQMLGRLRPGTDALCIPNCWFRGYWPTLTHGPQMKDFTDSFLESLISKGLPPDDVLRLYLQAAPELAGDVEAIAQESLRIEKAKQKNTPIQYAGWMEERWRQEQLFITFNHPAKALLVHIAQEILRALGMTPIPKSFIDGFIHPHNEFWQPIHPAFAERLNLPFAPASRRYPCFGPQLTHLEYSLCYLACRQNNFDDLPSALAASGKKAVLKENA